MANNRKKRSGKIEALRHEVTEYFLKWEAESLKAHKVARMRTAQAVNLLLDDLMELLTSSAQAVSDKETTLIVEGIAGGDLRKIKFGSAQSRKEYRALVKERDDADNLRQQMEEFIDHLLAA